MMARRDRLALRLCLFLVRSAARLVPGADRGAWLQEWEAELRHRWAHGRGMSTAAEITMVTRSFGSVVDAAWMRRQLTLDADVVHDTSHGARLLFKAPGFTVVALLIFAVGIGAATAIASVADALLVRRLPIPDADRVVTLWERNRATGVGQQDVAPGNAIDWVSKTTSFAAVAAIEPWSLDYTPRGGEPEVLYSARVSAGFFDAVGVPLLHGRAFLPHEFTQGGERVAVLSHALWQERFGGDATVIGRAVELDAASYVVVGVTRPDVELRLFEARREPRLYVPKYFLDFEPRIRGTGYWNVIGRLKPGVSIDHARAELDALSAQLAREYTANVNTTGEILPLREHLAGGVRALLPLLLGVAALLLFVACANVANLLLARGVTRGREFAVRQALGASRGRLIRQMLTESLLLAIAGGGLGLLLARWTLSVIAALRPSDVAGLDRLAIDARVAAIAIGVSLLAALGAGVMPAVQLSRAAAAAALREGTAGPGARRVRGLLVAIEVSVALLLVVGAGLLVRSLREIQRVDPGFARAQVLALQVFAWDRNTTPQKRAAFFEQTVDRLRAHPGVAAAGAVSAMPFIEANINMRSAIVIDGQTPAPQGDDPLIFTTIVAGDYFKAMGIPLERGRLIDRGDRADARTIALVSRSAARKFWAGADPLGSTVRVRVAGRPIETEIVGVVGDLRHDGLDRPGRAELFLSHPQVPFGSMTYVVRAVPGAPLSLQALKQEVWAVDPLQAFYRTATLDELVARTLVGRRFSVVLLSGFGAVALLLAAAGLYGVMSFSTRQRSREFGVRVALGAQPSDILRMVVREGVTLALAGVAAGVVAALALTRLIRGLLFGISASDPLTYVAAAAGILALSAAACYLPARRAVRSDPLVTLKAS
jgi:putative ABC transport system permease protein